VHDALPLLEQPDHLAWRNKLLDLITDSRLEVIVAFGGNAQAALHLWDKAPDVPVFEVPHPSDHSTSHLVSGWKAAIPGIRDAVTPDPDGDQTGPNYGTGIKETDYARIPNADLPFGLPSWMGDDHWGRTGSPRHNNAVARSGDDPDHEMVWVAPES
jgi:hypothetical protein